MTSTHQEWRESQYYDFDPYSSNIAPALLNSADIKKYIDIDCLLEKTDFDSKRLKPASYEMQFLGKVYDWTATSEGQLKRRCREICAKEPTILYRNSITYLWMKENLFLPEYIAARFNLHIRHVHKGLLLGTGPLVDPGFSGRLLIPLHNLTNNDYEIKGGDGIIWVEFTKLSNNNFWEIRDKDDTETPSALKMFPNAKDLDDPLAYFRKSGVTDEGGVQSAFHGALDETRNAAKKARRSAENSQESTESFKRLYTWAGLGSAVLILLAVGAIIFQGYSLVNQVVATTNQVHRQVEADRKKTVANTESLMDRIDNLEKRLEGAVTDINALGSQVDLNQQERAPPLDDPR